MYCILSDIRQLPHEPITGFAFSIPLTSHKSHWKAQQSGWRQLRHETANEKHFPNIQEQLEHINNLEFVARVWRVLISKKSWIRLCGLSGHISMTTSCIILNLNWPNTNSFRYQSHRVKFMWNRWTPHFWVQNSSQPSYLAISCFLFPTNI